MIQSVKAYDHSVENATSEKANCRVLVVDDNEASAKTLGWMLEFLGHTVALACDVNAAMEKIETFKPDAVLLDIGLPGTNGYDVCRMMRRHPITRDAVIIAQTGWGQEEHRKRSWDAGFDHHLVKPIDMNELKPLLEPVKVAEPA
jgi:CheY-like chemotaxis protein